MNKRNQKISAQSTPAKVGDPQPLPPGPQSIRRIEELARASLADGAQEQHIALLEMLTYIYLDPMWAHYARMAVVRLSDELMSDAANLIVLREQVTREPQKGGRDA